jgi:P-type Ca2+ transporter type 2C
LRTPDHPVAPIMAPTPTVSPTPPPAFAEWHALNVEEAVSRLKSDVRRGLNTQTAVTGRLTEYGPNRLDDKPKESKWAMFFGQFASSLIWILLGAAVLAAAIGNFKDASVIVVAVLLNATLGFIQEFRAEKSLNALKQMLALKSRVRRDGQIQEISADELVPGDIALLEQGDRVPADGLLVFAQSLEIDESALTGESHPVVKRANGALAAATGLADRINSAHMSTMVTRGRGEMLVTNTGMRTVMGKLSSDLSEAEEEETPLQKQLDRLGKRLTVIGLGFVALIFALGLWEIVSKHLPWMEELGHIVLKAIALAVATIPEGLPAVVTVTLALGMNRMAKNRAVVKRLAAVETLGCTTVICSDKTGTLTLNQMTARVLLFRGQRFHVTGEGYRTEGSILPDVPRTPAPDLNPLLHPISLCNESRLSDGRVIGDPMEGAMLVLAAKGGIDRESLSHEFPRVGEIPFDSTHKFMATFHSAGHRVGDDILVYVKGAPELVLERSTHWLGGRAGELAPQTLGHAERERILNENADMGSKGLRVLAVASAVIPAAKFDPNADLFALIAKLTFVGLVGLMDPPRPEAKEAIALCRIAGMQVKMITGDQQGTAAAIATELGLHGRVVTGAELDRMDTAQLAESVGDIAVFARVAPEHKTKIVQALKSRGEIVAMTGDGVNDAPALRNAHIGVAMGITGTEVAKEAASMVLTDDNFASIVGAVREGRTIYDNIVKFVRFQLSTNVGAIFTMFLAAAFELPDPFTPIQILWVNIIMDGPPAMALGLEPTRPEIMLEKPRRPGADILTWTRIARVVYSGAIMVIGTLGVMIWSGRTYGKDVSVTMAFTTFVMFQVFNVFNARSERNSTFSGNFFSNRTLWVAVTLVALLQILVVQWTPAEEVFRTLPLTLEQWAIVAGVAASALVLEEGRKLIVRLMERGQRTV